MIAATVTSGFAWLAAWPSLSLGLGLFFGPPGVGLIEFAALVGASVWLVWRKPLVAAGWFLIWAIAVVLRPYGPLIIPGSISCLTFLVSTVLAFEANREPKLESAPPTHAEKTPTRIDDLLR
jgi:putative effector of murein hydrolase LrgA (UPF0299 family)